jgi:hypothetical protein
MTLPRCLGLFALAALQGCIQQPSPTPTPAVVSTAPVSVETPEPARTPTAAPKRAVATTPAPKRTLAYVFAKPHAPPRILAIKLSSTTISGGETVSGSVQTSSNVASVEARIAGWSMSIPRTRIGLFEASGQIPDLPFLAKGKYTLEVIARNSDGVKAERDVSITLR